MAPKLRTLANEILEDPFSINIALAKPAEGVLQAAYMTYDNQKTPLIKALIKGKEEYQSILIFTSTKKNVSVIVRELRKKGFDTSGISSDLDQKQREEVLLKFTNKSIRILVATDVLSRGVDIKDINLVINYDVPGDAADYVHRIGRTARASTTGVALTFINPNDVYKFQRIEKLIEAEVPKIALPAELGDGPAYKTNSNTSGGGKKKYNNNNRKGGKKRPSNNRNNNRRRSNPKSEQKKNQDKK